MLSICYIIDKLDLTTWFASSNSFVDLGLRGKFCAFQKESPNKIETSKLVKMSLDIQRDAHLFILWMLRGSSVMPLTSRSINNRIISGSG